MEQKNLNDLLENEPKLTGKNKHIKHINIGVMESVAINMGGGVIVEAQSRVMS